MKTLAIFLGARLVSEKTLNPLITRWDSPEFPPLNGKFHSGHELRFDSDWNWMIAVVKKIYSLELECEEVLVVRDALAEANHADLVTACIDFVEWYKK